MNPDRSPRDDLDEFAASKGLVITTESESRAAASVLPTSPTEDARHVLGTIDLPPRQPDSPDREYLPDPTVEWIVDIRLEGDPRLDPRAVANVLREDWPDELGDFVEFGRDADTGRWSFLISSDGPQSVDRLKLAFEYVEGDPEEPAPDPHVFQQRSEQIRQRAERLGQATVTESASPADAHSRSRLLLDLTQDLDTSAVLILKAPAGKRFEGREVWDAMLCLGLHWGDMDCFHWRSDSDLGDDSLFSVETTTPPGYFLPQQIAAGDVQVDDLVFVYSVPRCARPVEVFDAMHRAVDYCRARLGGTIIDGDGRAADVAALRQSIVDTTSRLREAGFEPGHHATLRLF